MPLRRVHLDVQLDILNRASQRVNRSDIALSDALGKLGETDQSMEMLMFYISGTLGEDLEGWESNQDGHRSTRPLINRLLSGLKWVGQALKIVEDDYNPSQLKAMKTARENQLRALYPKLDPENQLRAGRKTLSCWRAEAAAMAVLKGRRDYYKGLLAHFPDVSMELVDAAVAVLLGYEPSGFWRGMPHDTDPVQDPENEILQRLGQPFFAVRTKR